MAELERKEECSVIRNKEDDIEGVKRMAEKMAGMDGGTLRCGRDPVSWGIT